MIPNEVELAWAAGFFDGEGCTYWSATQIRCEISQANNTEEPPETLLKFMEIFGGRILPRKSKTKPSYTLRLSGKKAKAALRAMWPFLGNLKKKQAQYAMKNYKKGGGTF